MLIALTLRKTDEPHRVHAWLERGERVARRNTSVAIRLDTVFSMSVYYLWKGEYHKNSSCSKRRRPKSVDSGMLLCGYPHTVDERHSLLG